MQFSGKVRQYARNWEELPTVCLWETGSSIIISWTIAGGIYLKIITDIAPHSMERK